MFIDTIHDLELIGKVLDVPSLNLWILRAVASLGYLGSKTLISDPGKVFFRLNRETRSTILEHLQDFLIPYLAPRYH